MKRARVLPILPARWKASPALRQSLFAKHCQIINPIVPRTGGVSSGPAEDTLRKGEGKATKNMTRVKETHLLSRKPVSANMCHRRYEHFPTRNITCAATSGLSNP